MAQDRHERLIELLLRSDSWLTAAELGDALGVTARSVRSYIQAVKDRSPGITLIESGPAGYRIDRDAYAAAREQLPGWGAGPSEPAARVASVLRMLIDASDGIELHETAAGLHVSESTVESDLVRIRARIADTGLRLRRLGSRITLEGPESAQRRLLSSLFRAETVRGVIELDRVTAHFSVGNLSAFKTELLERLAGAGYHVNEYGIGDVLLHLAIAVDRVEKARGMEVDTAQRGEAGTLPIDLGALVQTHFGTRLGDGDLGYLAFLLSTRVITPSGTLASDGSGFIGPELLDTVRHIVMSASAEYLVDLDDNDFIVRLTAHVQNLIRRAADDAYSRNPLTRSIKSSYPMIYDLAVYVASRLRRATGVEVTDDEIAYIAMHVGAQLERSLNQETRVTCTIVAPRYLDMHRTLLERVTRVFGAELDVVAVVTRSDVAWDELGTDLVLTTIEPPARGDDVLLVQPFLTPADLDHVRQAIARVRRTRSRHRLMLELREYFHPELFFRNLAMPDAESAIRFLGERMIERGVIDAAYVESTLERERLSSTAFTDALAVPHAMTMTAKRTSIAIAINETPVPWGPARVNVVALIAFSSDGRARFQTVFDQFVGVFSETSSLHRIVRRGTDYSAFIAELVRLFEE